MKDGKLHSVSLYLYNITIAGHTWEGQSPNGKEFLKSLVGDTYHLTKKLI